MSTVLPKDVEKRFEELFIGDIYLSNDENLSDETSVRECIKQFLADELATAERTAREELKTAIFGELKRSELEAVVSSMARAVGHTHAAIHGVKNTHNALLVLGEKHQEKSVDLSKDKTISLEDIKFGRLRGTRKAIVLDNFAVFNLWRDIMGRMEHVFEALAPSTGGEME